MKNRWIHLVARTQRGLRPFEIRDQSLWLWGRLKTRFPSRVLAALLMPNHLHLVLVTARPGEFRHALACQLRAFTRRWYPGRSIWEAIPPVDEIHDLIKLKTVIRYVHLNPCRARRTQDPWDWEFSTLRDHGGLSLSPWVDRERLRASVRMDSSEWKLEHESWIFRDDFVEPGLSEKRLAPPDLKTLSEDQVRSVIEWATGSLRGRLQKRGEAKDWYARLWMHLNPAFPLWKAESMLGIKRERLSVLRSLPLSSRDIRIFESIALSVRMRSSQRR